MHDKYNIIVLYMSDSYEEILNMWFFFFTAVIIANS